MKTAQELEKELIKERLVLRYALRELHVEHAELLINRLRDDVETELNEKEKNHVPMYR